MRKFKTDEIVVAIGLTKNDQENQNICIRYYNKDVEVLEENKVTLPADICKQSFSDAKFTQHVINFFIKD